MIPCAAVVEINANGVRTCPHPAISGSSRYCKDHLGGPGIGHWSPGSLDLTQDPQQVMIKLMLAIWEDRASRTNLGNQARAEELFAHVIVANVKLMGQIMEVRREAIRTTALQEALAEVYDLEHAERKEMRRLRNSGRYLAAFQTKSLLVGISLVGQKIINRLRASEGE